MEDYKTHSENAEMYLVSMAILAEAGAPVPIPIPQLAEEMDVQTVSANQMVRKLEEDGLVIYQPYKGVSFTPAGEQMVELILRNRRLWEVFFVQQLNFTPREADALACRMEHITQPEVAARLSEFLGHPTITPSGRQIPNLQFSTHPTTGTPLTTVQPGAKVEVLALNLDDAASAYLRSEGLLPGIHLEILAVSASGSVLVGFGNQRLSISGEIAVKILISASQKEKQYAV